MFPCDVSSSDPRASFEYNVGNTETRTQLLELPSWASFPVYPWWWIHVPAFSISFMWPPNTDWLVSLFPRSPEDAASKSSSVGGFLLYDLLCSFIPDRAWSGAGREGHPHSPCCFSKSVKHIDNPKSHQALALENVASLSCGKSSEWSLQPSIGIDCGWLHQKKEIMEEYWTVFTGWLGLGWK